MNTCTQSDTWITCTIIALGLILAASIILSIFLTLVKQPLSGVLNALGLVAATGLARLLMPLPWDETLFG